MYFYSIDQSTITEDHSLIGLLTTGTMYDINT